MKYFLILMIATCLISGCATTKASTSNQPTPSANEETVCFMPESNKNEGEKPFDKEANMLDWAETFKYLSCYTFWVPVTVVAAFLNNSNDVKNAGFTIAIL